jgi:hypothetical protein
MTSGGFSFHRPATLAQKFRGENMRKLSLSVCFLSALVLSALAVPLYAGNAPEFKRTVIAPRYDATKEITIEGTIQQLVTKPMPGAILGGHLIVSTSSGIIDAQIGSFILRGPQPFSPVAGQSVKIVGVMANINHRNVFLTRTIETENRTIAVRTPRGFFIIPGTQNRSALIPATGGAR